MSLKRLSIRTGIIGGILILCALSEAFPAPGSIVRLSRGQTVYVPVYSRIYGTLGQTFFLAITLSIRNTDLERPITILTADHMDSNGKLIKRYIEKSVSLNPISTIRQMVMETDKSDGSSFIVKWKADGEVTPPIIQAIMIGTQNQLGISFTSRGQVIREE